MRKYKSISLSPAKVTVESCQILPDQIHGGQKLLQMIVPAQQTKYALTIFTEDKQTFNRLLKRLSK